MALCVKVFCTRDGYTQVGARVCMHYQSRRMGGGEYVTPGNGRRCTHKNRLRMYDDGGLLPPRRKTCRGYFVARSVHCALLSVYDVQPLERFLREVPLPATYTRRSHTTVGNKKRVSFPTNVVHSQQLFDEVPTVEPQLSSGVHPRTSSQTSTTFRVHPSNAKLPRPADE